MRIENEEEIRREETFSSSHPSLHLILKITGNEIFIEADRKLLQICLCETLKVILLLLPAHTYLVFVNVYLFYFISFSSPLFTSCKNKTCRIQKIIK